MDAVVSGARDVALELQKQFLENYKEIMPYTALWFGLQMIVQYVIPAIIPSAFDWLGRKKGTTDRSVLAADAAIKLVATAHAMYVAVFAMVGMLDASAASLQTDLYSSTPLTRQLVTVACSYFVWDAVVCIMQRWELPYHLHAWACLAVFLAANRPFLHYMALVTLFFEASTPFLHGRAALIDAGLSNTTLFTLCNYAFGALFFIARLVIGWSACYAWWWDVEALVASGGMASRSHPVAVVRMYQVCCLLLCGLNGYWFWLIISRFLGGEKSKKTEKTGDKQS